MNIMSCFFFFFLQFYIVKENRGNEGTCVGVSRWPVHDFNHRTTSDMWLYRAYSGNLYHNGEQTLTLSSFTQGDFITCVLDMEARTISFGKNGEVLKPVHKPYLYFFSFFFFFPQKLSSTHYQVLVIQCIDYLLCSSFFSFFVFDTFWFFKLSLSN